MKKSAATCFLEGLRLARLEAMLESALTLTRTPAPVPIRVIAKSLGKAALEADKLSRSLKAARKVVKDVREVSKLVFNHTGAADKRRIAALDRALASTRSMVKKSSKSCRID